METTINFDNLKAADLALLSVAFWGQRRFFESAECTNALVRLVGTEDATAMMDTAKEMRNKLAEM